MGRWHLEEILTKEKSKPKPMYKQYNMDKIKYTNR